MKKSEKLALVVPTRDEAANILVLLPRIQASLEAAEIDYEILVVDDESGDGTAERVRAAAERDGRIRLLARRGERGLAGAILHGWQKTDSQILGVIDADLQHPPEMLPALYNAVTERCDLAIGSRYIEGGEVGGWNLARRLVSWVASWASVPLQLRGVRAQDPLSGFFLVRRRCLDGVEFNKSGFKLLLEILVRGHVRSVEEIPFRFGCRRAGRSKASVRAALDYIALLARLYREHFGSARFLTGLTANH